LGDSFQPLHTRQRSQKSETIEGLQTRAVFCVTAGVLTEHVAFMLDPSFSELLRTRLLVAALGESLASPWWRTHFLQSTGLSRLERIVPRTFRLAALEGATAAARRDHDALVAPHSYHLFRLPSAVEHRLRATAESVFANTA